MSPYTKLVAFLSFGLLLVFGWHFATVFGLVGSAPSTQGDFFIRVGVILVGFMVMSLISAVLIAKQEARAPEPDEREEKVELKAERLGLMILYAGLLILAWFVFTPMEPIQVANALLAVVCLSEFVKMSYALFILKKGF